jgi:hypothetical protein
MAVADAEVEFLIQRAIAAERERCAEVAYQRGRVLGEPAIGHDIAQTIRNSQSK